MNQKNKKLTIASELRYRKDKETPEILREVSYNVFAQIMDALRFSYDFTLENVVCVHERAVALTKEN